MKLRMVSSAVFAILCLAATLSPAQSATELFISEYIEGTSNNKAIEIFNGTGAPINLATGGYNIQMFFNGNPVAGLTINLTGTVAAGDVYVVAQSSASAAILAQADQTNGAGWFNGDDAVVLRKGTTIIDVIGQIGFDPGTEWGAGLTSTADNTLRRKLAITSGDIDGSNLFDPSAEWDGFATDTFDGLGNISGPVVPAIPAQIWEIQGAGLVSPLVGKKCVTEGNTVTAVFSDGFYIQDPSPDGDTQTSDGLFVFTGSAPAVHVGDEVKVEGTVAEFFNLTELTGVNVTVTASGQPVPAPVTLDENNPPSDNLTALERHEGMLVRVVNGRATGPSNQFNEVSMVARSTPTFREPGILFPGLPGLPVWDGNPEVFEIDTDRFAAAPGALIPRGATIELVEGPLTFAFGDYQILPSSLEVTGAPKIVPVRNRTSGEFTVGSQNMLRLFDTVNDPDVSDEVLTPTQYQNRLSKLSQQVRIALRAPDVLAVQEVENIQALGDLANRINTDDPSLAYEAHLVEGNDIGGIDVGFLVRSSVQVDSIEQFGKDDTFVFNGVTALLNDRPPLVLRGAYVGNDSAAFPIVVINVHQRSLNDIDDPSQGARVRAKRHEQAVRLAKFIQDLQDAEPGIRLVVIGDFNAFEFTDGYVDVMGQVTGNPDPLGALIPVVPNVSSMLTNQTLNMPAEERYSFVFDGNAQSLDHALTSQPLDPWVRAAQHARGNADTPQSFDDDPSTALRSSDHDGTVVFIMSDFDADGFADDQDNCPQAANADQLDSDRDGIGDACDPVFAFGFNGLLEPYAPPPAAFRANRSIPLKWQYTDISGNVINSSGASPTVNVFGPMSCGETSGATVIDVAAAGNSGYQYEAATNTWQFNWKTTGLPADCYNIQVTSPQAQPSPLFTIQLK